MSIRESEQLAPLESMHEIGRYRLLRPIGAGGLSQVFEAHDTTLDRRVALKVLRPKAVSLQEARDWIGDEGRSLAKLEHQNIVRVLDTGEESGHAFIAMEYIQAPSLHRVLDELRHDQAGTDSSKADPLAREVARTLSDLPTRCRLVMQVARALAYCHEQGVIHRDVKPGNILVDQTGNPKLIDFGLARLTGSEGQGFVTEELVGTLPYLAPEQVDDERTGASTAADQFSLGVVLYELLTLQHPFLRDTRHATMAAISRSQPTPSQKVNAAIPADLELISRHCLQANPDKRYPAVADLAGDLDAFLGFRAISLRAPTPWGIGLSWVRRHQREVAITLLVVIAAVIAGTWYGIGQRDSVEEMVSRSVSSGRSISEPSDFAIEFRRVDDARRTARELDRSWLTGFIYTATSPLVERWWMELSERLSKQYERETQQALELPSYWGVHNGLNASFVRWVAALFAQEKSRTVGPEFPHNRLGRVDLPANGTLFRHRSTKYGWGLQEVDPESQLQEYLYRYRVRKGAEYWERDFWTHTLRPAWTLLLKEPDRNWLAATVAFPRKKVRLEGRGGEDRPVPAFRISKRVITIEEARRVLGQKVSLYGDIEDAKKPAAITWALAHRYCTLVGGRLPTPLELRVALSDPRIEQAPAPFDAEHVVSGFEESPSLRGHFHYSSLDQDPMPFNSVTMDDGYGSNRSFRVAISEPEPD